MNIEYALKNDRIVHVSEVDRGLKCGCTCPGCGERMVAKKGQKTAHHFAHYNADCAHGLETTLHLMAKEILECEKRIMLPEVVPRFSYNAPKEHTISRSKMIHFDEVVLEKRLAGVRPDVFVKTGSKHLLIEICVSNDLDREKHKKIEMLGISTLEINLFEFDRMISKDELREVLIKGEEHKYWIYNRLVEDYKKKWLSLCEKKLVVYRGNGYPQVDECPIGARMFRGYEPYANAEYDCRNLHEDPYNPCDYFVDYECFDRWNDEPEYIYCSGKARIGTIDDLKKYLNV